MTDFLGEALRAGRMGDAQGAYRLLVAAVEADGDSADAWYRLGCLLHDNRNHQAAVAAFARANELRPGDHETLTNLGWNLHLCDRSVEAAPKLYDALEAREAALALINLAQIVPLVEGKWSPALAMARRAVALEPERALMHMGLAFQLMFAGEYAEGFRELEWRFRYDGHATGRALGEMLKYPYPLWRGEIVDTLYIRAEQGIGDAVWALRWLPLVGERAKRIVFHVHAELLRLFHEQIARWSVSGAVSASVRLEALEAPMPEADAWVGMLSLPVALGIEDFEDGDVYIHPSAATGWEVCDPPEDVAPLQVGICWAGNDAQDDAKYKNISLAEILRLAEVPGVRLHSLQVGPHRQDMADAGAYGLVRDRASELTGMAETARVIAGLDLVVSVDTAVAHLAGALGKLCWLLLSSRGGDGRWGRTGERTSWYSSVRLWRRGLDEGWADVLARVAEALRERGT